MNNYVNKNKPISINSASMSSGVNNTYSKAAIKLPESSDMNVVELREIVRNLKALDTHAELREMIGYLKIMASSKGSGNAMGDILSDSTKRRLADVSKKAISRNKGPLISQSKMDTLMNMHNNTMDLSQDSYELAYNIARGGQFRKI